MKDGGYTRYYAARFITPEEKMILSIIRKELPRTIVLFIMERGVARNTDLSNAFNVSGATISYHLKRMVEKNILSVRQSGRERIYEIKNPEAVMDVLIKYRKSFADALTDKIIRSWTLKKERGKK